MFHYFIVALKYYFVFSIAMSALLLFSGGVFSFTVGIKRRNGADEFTGLLMVTSAISILWGMFLVIQCWFDVNMPHWLWLQY